MSAMRDMSRAIRHELQELGPTLQDIGDKELAECTEILGAFFYDLVGEQDRRGWGSPRPAATVAAEIKDLRTVFEAARKFVGLREGCTYDAVVEGLQRVQA